MNFLVDRIFYFLFLLLVAEEGLDCEDGFCCIWHPDMRKQLKGEITQLSEADFEEIITWATTNMKKFVEVCNRYLK